MHLLLINIAAIFAYSRLPHNIIGATLPIAFMMQGTLSLLALSKVAQNKAAHLASPSILALTYLTLSYAAGSFTMQQGLGLGSAAYTINHMWQKILQNAGSISLTLLSGLAILTCVACSEAANRSRALSQHLRSTHQIPATRHSARAATLFIAFLLLFVFTALPLDLSFAGGFGDFSYPVRLTSCISIFIAARHLPTSLRLSTNAIAIAAMMIQSYDSKREGLFVLIAAAAIEFATHRTQLRGSTRQFVATGFACLTIVVFIAWSSIMRGYGQYHPKSAVEGLSYVPTYLREPFFWDAAANNFETNAVFGNTAYCHVLISQGRIETQLGATLIKIAFIPIPRDILPQKPRSMIDLYTSVVAPQFRQARGSLPVTFPVELYANFHLPGLILLFPLFIFLDRLYTHACVVLQNTPRLDEAMQIRVQSGIFLACTTVLFVRGSGLEMYIIYFLIGAPLMWITQQSANSPYQSRTAKQVVLGRRC